MCYLNTAIEFALELERERVEYVIVIPTLCDIWASKKKENLWDVYAINEFKFHFSEVK